MKITLVTATLDPLATKHHWLTWPSTLTSPRPLVMVWTGPKTLDEAYRAELLELLPPDTLLYDQPTILGVVPAFLCGIILASNPPPDSGRERPSVLACFHDDLSIFGMGWDGAVERLFVERPLARLCGFGGALGLGREGMYAEPYDPMSLARHSFMSNMRDAEKHGRRELRMRQVACLDGFSQIGRTDFMEQAFSRMAHLGLVHHAFDSMLGALCRREGCETWYLPVACHHAGGMTAVANTDYAAWAKTQEAAGDQGFWAKSHRAFFDECRDVLPFRVMQEGGSR